MPFKRFFAMLLLLLLPLQSAFAAMDVCCDFASEAPASSAAVHGQTADGAASPVADEANCCVQCDFCNHSSVSFFSNLSSQQIPLPGAAPIVRPESPFQSFIPDVPSRPDLG